MKSNSPMWRIPAETEPGTGRPPKCSHQRVPAMDLALKIHLTAADRPDRLGTPDMEITREQCLSLLLCHDLSSDELATTLRKDVHDVRSRCSELKAAGLIRDSGQRRKNPHGIATRVWTTRRLATCPQPALN
ncbi:MAG TPA: hypothetical protein VF607_02480 [Verrucomicrobiae bacterium]